MARYEHAAANLDADARLHLSASMMSDAVSNLTLQMQALAGRARGMADVARAANDPGTASED